MKQSPSVAGATTQAKREWLLHALVFTAGMTTMAAEMAAARLLSPWFGDSLPIWACLIGLILVYLSVGNWLGGRWADRSPLSATLFQIGLWAAFLLGLVPVVGRPVLKLASTGMAEMNVGLLVGPLAAVLLLLALPVTLLGCVSPFAVRLLLSDTRQGGSTSGKLYALSTVGSLVGTFLSVLVTIPNLGTRMTFTLFSVALWLVAWVGLLQRARRRALPYLLMLAVVLALAWLSGGQAVKADEELVYEKESAYNYIQVLEWGPGTRLKLNEGYGVQSVYNPYGGLTGGIWDYFLIAPFFGAAPQRAADVESLCLIGLAGGTIPKLYTQAYGPLPIDGVELDGEVVSAGRMYLAMNEPNVRVIVADGRAFLSGLAEDQQYDVIAVDAYRPPYVPFHLATVEFFKLCREHLSENGVVAVNGARVEGDDRLVQAIASTMAAVFPSIYIVEEPSEGFATGNSLIVGTKSPTTERDWLLNSAMLEQPLLVEMANRAQSHVAPYHTEAALQAGSFEFTDDLAPVEQMVHGTLWSYLTGSATAK